MTVHCTHCQDSGRSPGSESLDCTRCGAAVERAAFDRWSATWLRNPANSRQEHEWAIYQRGKAARDADVAALTTAARSMWGWAIQIGEQFDRHPDNDKTREDWKRQCDEVRDLLKNYQTKI